MTLLAADEEPPFWPSLSKDCCSSAKKREKVVAIAVLKWRAKSFLRGGSANFFVSSRESNRKRGGVGKGPPRERKDLVPSPFRSLRATGQKGGKGEKRSLKCGEKCVFPQFSLYLVKF